MTNPSSTTTAKDKNIAGFLLIVNKRLVNGKKLFYIEKCEKLMDRYNYIRQGVDNNNIFKMLVRYSSKAPEHFKNENDEIDYRAWFLYNWSAINGQTRYSWLGAENVADDVKLCRFWDQMKLDNYININALIEDLSNYHLKRKLKKKQKVKCPYCSRLVTRTNLSRHKKYNCKIISNNKA